MSVDPKRQALRDAAQWFAQMCANPDDPALQMQWKAWHGDRLEHQWAWQHLTSLQTHIGKVPQQLGWQVMEQVNLQGAGVSRRNLLGGLVLGAGVGALGWRGINSAPVWMADLRTATGEQRRERLSDGTVLVLDTSTAVDVAFDAGTRLLILRSGNIHVVTGKDPRPFIVRSAQGDMRALGTRFAVLEREGQTRLSVYEHAVAVRAGTQVSEAVVTAGHSVTFDRQGMLDARPPRADEESWSQGRLTVDDWSLGQLINELQRYRPGYLGCAPEVSHLSVSGTYPLNNIDVALSAVALSLPVRLQQYTRFWTRIIPA